MVIEKQRGLLETLRQAQTPEERNFLRRYVRAMRNRHGYLLNTQKARQGTVGIILCYAIEKTDAQEGKCFSDLFVCFCQ